MQRVNLHARPSIIQVQVGGVSHLLLSGVCTRQWKRGLGGGCWWGVGGGAADLDYPSEPYHHNDAIAEVVDHL